MVLALRFAHILFAAGWFGATMFLSGDVRRTVALGPPHTNVLADRVGRYSKSAAAMGWLTVILGVALIFAMGGFTLVSPAIHIALLIAIVLVGVGMLMGRTWGQVAAQLVDGGSPDPALLKRLSALNGVFQLGWVVILALMVFRHLLF